jgi:transposase
VQDDCILVALGLPQLAILKQREYEDRFEVTVIYRREKGTCPRCGQETTKEHERRFQRKRDRKIRDKPVYLTLIKRRFRCPWCQKVFTEADEVFGARRRSSQRLRCYLGEEALHQTVRRVALKEEVGEGLVRRCVAEEVGQRLDVSESTEAPDLMGLDEFSVRKGHMYHTVICDLTDRKVMAVVEGQGRQKLEEYLNKLQSPEAVKAVAMDMHDPFRQAVQMCLPEAQVVVDKFHLIRHVNDAMDKVRSRCQGGRNREGKKRGLYKNRYILLKGAENLIDWERESLRRLFMAYPEVKQAWLLKERFRRWYRTLNRDKAEKELMRLEEQINQVHLPEFKQLLPTLRKWREEILNYFNYHITNGFLEGKNNRIKTIKRMAYGYRNIENFKLRIMATNLDTEARLSHLLT